jgi:hypothetical protein
MKTLLTMVALIGLAACSNSEDLATPTGPVFALNPGHWQPTPTDLQPLASGTAE